MKTLFFLIFLLFWWKNIVNPTFSTLKTESLYMPIFYCLNQHHWIHIDHDIYCELFDRQRFYVIKSKRKDCCEVVVSEASEKFLGIFSIYPSSQKTHRQVGMAIKPFRPQSDRPKCLKTAVVLNLLNSRTLISSGEYSKCRKFQTEKDTHGC